MLQRFRDPIALLKGAVVAFHAKPFSQFVSCNLFEEFAPSMMYCLLPRSIFMLPDVAAKGVSQAGAQGGLMDKRTGLLRCIFDCFDRLRSPFLGLCIGVHVLQNFSSDSPLHQ